MIPEKEKLFFTKNITVMMRSGIPLAQAVRSQSVQTRNPTFRRVLSRVTADIEAGQRFSVALERHSPTFSPFYVNAVRAGEKSGSLEQNLDYIADQLEASIVFKKTLTSALMYPAFLLVAVVCVSFLIGWFVLPTITDLLTSFETDPPLPTKIVIGMGYLFKNFGAVMAIALLLCAVGAYALAQTRGGRDIFDHIILHVPILGKVFRQVYLVETTKMLSTLLKSGVPVHESLAITADSVSNAVFRRALRRIIPEVLRGNPISPFLDRRLFTPLFVQMMEVGEKSARVEQNLTYLSSFFQREVESTVKNLLTLLEPALLILVGVAVLLLALAIIGPLYQVAGG